MSPLLALKSVFVERKTATNSAWKESMVEQTDPDTKKHLWERADSPWNGRTPGIPTGGWYSLTQRESIILGDMASLINDWVTKIGLIGKLAIPTLSKGWQQKLPVPGGCGSGHKADASQESKRVLLIVCLWCEFLLSMHLVLMWFAFK